MCAFACNYASGENSTLEGNTTMPAGIAGSYGQVSTFSWCLVAEAEKGLPEACLGSFTL